MAVPDHALETFRVINGLSHEDRLKAGERVKIVVE
jgi:predicted Zn-dependent protease